MRRLLLLALFVGCGWQARAGHSADSIAVRLKSVIEGREQYQSEKEQRIATLQQLRAMVDLQPSQAYQLNAELSAEYRKYNTDSAVVYALKNQTLATELANPLMQSEVAIQLADLYSSKGLYVEARAILADIDVKNLPKTLQAEYYYTLTEFFSHYAQSSSERDYYRQSEHYRDALLAVLDPQSFRYQVEYAKKILYRDTTDEAEKLLLSLLAQTTDKDLDRALVAYLLATKYKLNNNKELQQKYLSISAIADLVSCNKDNASLQALALYYREAGDVDRAYQFIQLAIEDALLCNVRYRTMEGSEYYPIINSAYQMKEKKQKEQLQRSLIIISILTFFLLLGIVHIGRQMKKLSSTRSHLHRANEQLHRLNSDLQGMNASLSEANHVKEEYIAYFFDACSEYIDKLENYRKNLNSKAKNNKLDDLFATLKSNTLLETELDELYKNFDTIFLSIYPNFIKDFNALLLPEEQIHPKNDRQLTPELRIFALIRLGITDSVKIAKFLRYSLRTVYNYRTKVRNKAAGNRDEFEKAVLFLTSKIF